MAPASKSSSKNEEFKQEDILQAVVFADSFSSEFAPISDTKPRALFPVANTPLIDYTLEFLCSGGVQEVFVVCCHLADQIKEHIRSSRWSDRSSPCNVVPVVTDGCMSMGDALRDIDAKSVIRSDFILVHGDLVSNINLKPIVEEHKQRREKDKAAVMTMVYQQVPPCHGNRSPEEDVFVAVDNQTQNVLHYQRISQHSNSKKISVPIDVMLNHKDVQLCYDLQDAGISICSPQVPMLFTDNFDYETRDSFVKGILINEEIMGNTIQIHVVTDAYGRRVSNMHMYDVVSRDILNRWTFPYVPDNCCRHNQDSISLTRHNIYKSREVSLARDCSLEENVLIGRASAVDSQSVISDSILGKNCKIGKNVKIRGSYLWDNVTVEDNCVIERSLLCDGVTVYKDVTLTAGCVLTTKVCVGPSVMVEQGTIAVFSLEDDFGIDQVDAADGTKGETEEKYGRRGHAFTYVREDNDDSDTEDIARAFWELEIKSDAEEDDDDDESDKSSESDSEPSLPPDVPVYYTELIDTLQRASDENIDNENLILEINSLKHAYNISIKELTRMVVQAILEQPLSEDPSQAGPAAAKLLKAQVLKRLPILQNYIKGADSQLHCLQALQDFASSSSSQMGLLVSLIHCLYDEEILSEAAIFKWYKLPAPEVHGDASDDEDPSSVREKHVAVRKTVAPLIKWLEEAEEESSEED